MLTHFIATIVTTMGRALLASKKRVLPSFHCILFLLLRNVNFFAKFVSQTCEKHMDWLELEMEPSQPSGVSYLLQESDQEDDEVNIYIPLFSKVITSLGCTLIFK